MALMWQWGQGPGSSRLLLALGLNSLPQNLTALGDRVFKEVKRLK